MLEMVQRLCDGHAYQGSGTSTKEDSHGGAVGDGGTSEGSGRRGRGSASSGGGGSTSAGGGDRGGGGTVGVLGRGDGSEGSDDDGELHFGGVGLVVLVWVIK